MDYPRKVRSVSLGFILIVCLSLLPFFQPATHAEKIAPPQNALLGYYNAINVKDYTSAYQLWAAPQQSLQNFSSGFSDTIEVLPYFGDYQPASKGVPAVLIARHTDSTTPSFYGCFYVTYQSTGWKIRAADFREAGKDGVPNTATLEAYLGVDCSNISKAIPFVAEVFSDHDLQVRQSMTLFYDFINLRKYDSAYQMWLHPLPGPKPNGAPAVDYRLPYDTFVKGYATTLWVNMYLGKYQYGGASAGHPYLDGIMPAVLIGEQTDGTLQVYSGCYVLGGSQTALAPIGIVSGTLNLWSTDVPTGAAIDGLLDTPCTNLNF